MYSGYGLDYTQNTSISNRNIIRSFLHKLLQIVVQSRYGNVSNPSEKPPDWEIISGEHSSQFGHCMMENKFNLDLYDNLELTSKFMKSVGEWYLTIGSSFTVEILIHSADNELFTLEMWTVHMTENSQSRPNDTAALYSKLSTLLKSAILATRVTPGFRQSFSQNHTSFVMLYNILISPPNFKRLGPKYEEHLFHPVQSSEGTYRLEIRYRTNYDNKEEFTRPTLHKDMYYSSLASLADASIEQTTKNKYGSERNLVQCNDPNECLSCLMGEDHSMTEYKGCSGAQRANEHPVRYNTQHSPHSRGVVATKGWPVGQKICLSKKHSSPYGSKEKSSPIGLGSRGRSSPIGTNNVDRSSPSPNHQREPVCCSLPSKISTPSPRNRQHSSEAVPVSPKKLPQSPPTAIPSTPQSYSSHVASLPNGFPSPLVSVPPDDIFASIIHGTPEETDNFEEMEDSFVTSDEDSEDETIVHPPPARTERTYRRNSFSDPDFVLLDITNDKSPQNELYNFYENFKNPGMLEMIMTPPSCCCDTTPNTCPDCQQQPLDNQPPEGASVVRSQKLSLQTDKFPEAHPEEGPLKSMELRLRQFEDNLGEFNDLVKSMKLTP